MNTPVIPKGPIFIILLSWSCWIYSEIQVRSFIKPVAISPKDSLTLTVEVEYESPVSISDPRLPDLITFRLIGQNKSHQILMINGQRTNKKQYQYFLQPTREGKFRLDAIEVVVDGQVYSTTPQEEVEVSSKIKPKPRAHSLPFGLGRRGLSPFFSDPFFSDPFFKEKEVNEQDIFLKLKVDKTKAYVGEMILAEWSFYFPLGSSFFNSEVTKSPTLDGFWVESVFQLGAGSASRPQRVQIKGQNYVKQKLIVHALFPVQAGHLTVGSLKSKKWPSGFKNFFSGSAKPILKESNTQAIKAIPLPEEGKGPLWTSAVGDFTVSAELSKDIVAVGDPVVYKVLFKGKGHPHWISLPKLDFGSDWTVYDTTESQKFSLSESHKTYEVILIPNRSGDLLTPSFELSTFDSNLGIYKTHILPSLKLKVAGVSLMDLHKNNKREQYFSDKKEDQKSKSLEPQMLSPWIEKNQNKFFHQYRKPFWLSIYGFLIVCFILSLSKMLWFKQRQQASLNTNLKASFKKVDQAIKSKDWKSAGRILQQTMYDFFSAGLEPEEATKNWSVLLKKLPLSIRIKYEKAIYSLIFQIEKLSFAPETETKDLQNQKAVLELKNSLLNLISKINKEYSNYTQS